MIEHNFKLDIILIWFVILILFIANLKMEFIEMFGFINFVMCIFVFCIIYLYVGHFYINTMNKKPIQK